VVVAGWEQSGIEADARTQSPDVKKNGQLFALV